MTALQCRLSTVTPHALGQSVDRQKAHIVRRELVLDARISEPDNQFHQFLVLCLLALAAQRLNRTRHDAGWQPAANDRALFPAIRTRGRWQPSNNYFSFLGLFLAFFAAFLACFFAFLRLRLPRPCPS